MFHHVELSYVPVPVRPATVRKHNTISYHAHTLWLFSCADIKNALVPSLAFAVATSLPASSAASSSTIGIDNASQSASVPRYLAYVTLAAVWVWVGILMENIGNQRLPVSIEEDKLNKPWRPLASGRITQQQAWWMLLATFAVGYFLSVLLQVQGPFLALTAFCIMYNDCDGAEHLVFRNVLNACGIMTLATGATMIISAATTNTASPSSSVVGSSSSAFSTWSLLGASAKLSPETWTWILLVGVVITLTISVQDLGDVEGDRLRDRKTLPLVWGDRPSRTFLAASIALSNCACLTFWDLPAAPVCLLSAVTAWLAWSVWSGKSVKDDKKAWKVWSLWIVLVFSLPLLQKSSVA